MTIVLRAADIPEASRTDHWHHIVDQTLGQLEVRPGGIDHRDQLRLGEAGAVQVAELTTGRSGGADRTRKHIRRADLDVCKVDVLVRGRGVVEQDGRQAALGPGDLTFVDLSRPVHWTMSAMRTVAVVFPRALLPLDPGEVAGLTAVAIPGDRGTGALVSVMARELARRLDDWDASAGSRLGTAVLDLVTVALADRLDRGGRMPRDAWQRALLLRVHAFIEQRLGDRALTPDAIAAAHHISPRYLYKLFESEQTSVAGWIRRRRLERCRRDLSDLALADRPVSAIAARWGLTSAAHFSRAFRAAYGLAPTEYRLLAANGNRADSR
jgi:AraC-like DNA-binding protein